MTERIATAVCCCMRLALSVISGLQRLMGNKEMSFNGYQLTNQQTLASH